MVRKDRYRIADSTRKVCAILKISPETVLRRAGLPADYLRHEGRGVDARRYFGLWNAVVAEAKRPDLALFLGKKVAHGPFNPAVFAFYCSPTIETGLTRLALFKPLIGPISLTVERGPEAVIMSLSSADADAPMPSSLSAFELVFFIELARTFTAEHIVPLSVGMPDGADDCTGLEAHFGIAAEPAEHATIALSVEDAERPLVTRNDAMWAGLEQGLRRELSEKNREAPMSARVENALLEMLPSGQSSAEAVCDRLNVSKRSLYRHLRNEGQSFQGLLDGVRTDLSLHYLAKGDISVEEISYLLAFRDPNSFYRAFRGWTGMTPMEARTRRTH